MLTLAALKTIMPLCGARGALFLPFLNAGMDEFEINTPDRRRSFLSQVAHESCQLVYTREIASGAAYEGRKDLGNTHIGDGVRFKGRGLIQITGRTNYVAVAAALGIDCVNHPELLESPAAACRSACWWWKQHGCNELADAGNQTAVSKRVNGGYNGLADRLAFYASAQKVMV